MKSLLFALALTLIISLSGCGPETPPAEAKRVSLKPVSLDEFLDVLKANKGKVVVIDFWATWCPPCRASFPHHVELHREYQDKDVVCMSVSLDKLSDKDEALTFLRRHKATFPNFIPDDRKDAWLDHWQIDGIPALMVYDRSGELHRGYHAGNVKKVIEKLLNQ
jgi:thiol-disulfide isomerase/thioredoxin